MISVVLWEVALEELQKLLPKCSNFLPETIIGAATEAGCSLPIVSLNG